MSTDQALALAGHAATLVTTIVAAVVTVRNSTKLARIDINLNGHLAERAGAYAEGLAAGKREGG